MPLKDATVKNAKPREKPYRIHDGGGLYLYVTPIKKDPTKAGKSWQYRYKFNNKPKTLTLGKYPLLTLKGARNLRDEAESLLAKGIDPSIEKKNRKKPTGKTFKEVALSWANFKSLPNTKRSWKPTHKKDVIKSLEINVFPVIGEMVITTITIDDIERVLDPISNRGALDVLNRVLGRIEAIFRYGKVKRWCTHNPAEGLREVQPIRKTQHMKYIKREDLQNFLIDLDNYQGDYVCKSAVKFVLLTHLRTKEIRGLEWEFIDFEKRLINIPARVMKMDIPQTVPLSNQALELLESLKPITGSSKYVFASLIKMSQPISENGMLSVIYRMGYKGKTTVHGLRSTFSTIANEILRFRPDAIEAALAHKVVDPVRAAYCHATYLEERTENIQEWADFLDEERAGRENIIQFKKANG